MIRLEKKSKVLFQLDKTLIVTLPMLADKNSWKQVVGYLQEQKVLSTGNKEYVVIGKFSIQYDDVPTDGSNKVVNTKMQNFPGPAYFAKKLRHLEAGDSITLPGNFTKVHPAFNRTKFGF